MPQFSFDWLMKRAEQAKNYLEEGERLLKEVSDNYADARDTIKETDREKLEAKLAEVRAKSAEVHNAIQSQE